MQNTIVPDPTLWPHAPRHVSTAAGRLHYVEAGDGPTVVLVHGTPTWGFEWRHLIPRIAQHYRVLVPDHLGFGLSERPPGADYTPEAHAARFAEFMQAAAGEGSVHLVLHDFGCPIAMLWVLENLQRVRGITVVNTWMWSFADDPVMWRRAGMIDGALGRLLYRHANASLRLIMPSAYADCRRLTPAVHAHYLAAFPDADSRERVLFALATSLRGSSAFFDGLWHRRAGLARVPMSIVWGMKDTAFGPAILARWTDAFPHAHVTRLADAGHWPHEEQPTATADAVLVALQRAAPGTSPHVPPT